MPKHSVIISIIIIIIIIIYFILRWITIPTTISETPSAFWLWLPKHFILIIIRQ